MELKVIKKNKVLLVPLVLLCSGFLFACSSYKPMPLPISPTFAKTSYEKKIDLNKGLDIADIAILAVLNNPDLKLARDDAKVTQAQSFAAGLLPNPQISLSKDIPINSGEGLTQAYNIGLSHEITSLFVQPSLKKITKEEARKSSLNLLWQEWQVVTQARTYFVRYVEQQKLMDLLKAQQQVLQFSNNKINRAMLEGNETIDHVNSQMVLLHDINQKIKDLAQQINQNHSDLNVLLGLSPDYQLKLNSNFNIPETPLLTKNEITKLLQQRPDILALQAGYSSQETRLYQAVLEQFPAITLGVTRARDTSDVSTRGFNISINLPIFNHNQGNIAIETATRQKLHDEYQQRLNTTYSDIALLQEQQTTLLLQQQQMQKELAVAKTFAQNAQQAYKHHNMELNSYAAAQTAALSSKYDYIVLEQSILEQRIAIQAMLSLKLPVY